MKDYVIGTKKEREYFYRMFQEKMERASLNANDISKLSGVSSTCVRDFLAHEFKTSKMTKPINSVLISAAVGLTKKELEEVMSFRGYTAQSLFKSKKVQGQWKDVCELRELYLKAKKELTRVRRLIQERKGHDYMKKESFLHD